MCAGRARESLSVMDECACGGVGGVDGVDDGAEGLGGGGAFEEDEELVDELAGVVVRKRMSRPVACDRSTRPAPR